MREYSRASDCPCLPRYTCLQDGVTPLQLASWQGHTGTEALLITQINFATEKLMQICGQNEPDVAEVVRLVTECGANVKFTNKVRTAPSVAIAVYAASR